METHEIISQLLNCYALLDIIRTEYGRDLAAGDADEKESKIIFEKLEQEIVSLKQTLIQK